MQKVLYLLLSVFTFQFFATSAHASGLDGIRILPDVDSIVACPDVPLVLSVDVGTGFSWTPAGDFDDPTAQTVTLTPSAAQWYFVSAMVGDSLCTDSIYVSLGSVSTFEIQVVAADTLCPLDEVLVSFISDGTIDSVVWNFTEGVDDTTSVSGTAVYPLETTEYVVNAFFGACSVSDTFNVLVKPFRFRRNNPDTIYICLGDSATIQHTVLPMTTNIVWSPLDTTITVFPQGGAIVKPTITSTYTATGMAYGCTLTTTTVVRVDSLPDGNLIVIPQRDPYCAGEEVTIFAQRADTLKYPDIMFEWSPDDGQIKDSTNTGNVFIVVQDTTEFIRIMRNNACRDTSSVILNTIPPDVPLSVMDTTLCPGDQFVVEILDLDVTDIEWMPETGLSCSDCFNPTVTVQDQAIPYTMQGKKDRCTVTGMLNVNVYPPYIIPVTPSISKACPGDRIQYLIDTTGLTGLNVTVEGSGSVSCSGCPNPIVTYNGGLLVLNVVANESFTDFCGAFGSASITDIGDSTVLLQREPLCVGVAQAISLSHLNLINPMLSTSHGAQLSCTTCDNPEVTISGPDTLTIVSQLSDTSECTVRYKIPLAINANAASSQFTTEPASVGQGESATITLVTNPMEPVGTLYMWTVNNQPVSETTSSITVPLPLVSNTVIVSWMHENGCVQMDTLTIVTDEPDHKIPKAFTPNRDLNSHFKVQITGLIEIQEMLVFNRWGQVVYEGTSQEGWDGNRDGEPAPPEVYVYLVKLRYPDGRVVVEKGDVTLIR